MYSIILDTKDPCVNLATEDYLLHNRNEDFIILSINDPSVIIGKHQCLHREVDTRFTSSENIPVLRRISGGGSVYHDHGNLNFAFIRQSEKGKQVDFRFYTQPVIDFLKSIGIDAVFEGKNDIRADGLKISGNAEHVYRERVLHHGTLLFDADLQKLRRSLRPVNDCYTTRAVESNRSSVTNLKKRLGNIGDISSFADSMILYLNSRETDIRSLILSEDEIRSIHELAGSKYRTWEWNYGYGPPYTFTNAFDSGNFSHRVSLYVKDGIIWKCDIEGSSEMAAAGKKLIGCRHMYEDLEKLFRTENIPVDKEEIWQFF